MLFAREFASSGVIRGRWLARRAGNLRLLIGPWTLTADWSSWVTWSSSELPRSWFISFDWATSEGAAGCGFYKIGSPFVPPITWQFSCHPPGLFFHSTYGKVPYCINLQGVLFILDNLTWQAQCSFLKSTDEVRQCIDSTSGASSIHLELFILTNNS